MNRYLYTTLFSLLFSTHLYASDAIDYPHEYRTGFHVGFANKETIGTEIAWQLLNVIDTAQTRQIAKNPACYQEVGQLELISNHPTLHQVYIGSAAFSVIHYLVAKGINSLVEKNSDYMVIQRVYQYSNLAFKTYTVDNNFRIGLDLTHSRNCAQ